MKIYFATCLHEKNQGEALTNIGGKQRLLSYYLIKTSKKEDKLKRYIKEGRIPK